MAKSFGPGGCPANTYILSRVATLQASIDAAITKVRNLTVKLLQSHPDILLSMDRFDMVVRRQCGQVVRALDLRSRGPGFKSQSEH